ncbi:MULTISPECIES: response regulator transcription factor [unclassified Micromonospora]|uniref:response regulator n=1 Tax=unclassified Micromonospora TaxID=2617518 RepID=UPI0022B5E72C|nr:MULTISPECIES: response regulator transcription factor [unclassified Micromonospora]MCZ7421953.1 response regulator transcription factor [Verrucosispora sp. WMMA2121]WBB93313.1 response regulator transcription factor [Verrucosispora sp. WMMC514]
MTIKVVVADDHGSVRAGIALILGNAPGIEVVGEAADGAEAIAQARSCRPDVMLMDIRMPGMNGITATRTVIAESLCEVLILTTFDLDEYVYGALRAGAAGFLLKSVEAGPLIDAVRVVAAGDGVLAPEITRKLISTFASSGGPLPPAKPAVNLDELTNREREVLICLGRGLSNAQIGAQLFIGETTVKSHVSKVLTKLNLRSRVQAAILVQEMDLTDLNDQQSSPHQEVDSCPDGYAPGLARNRPTSI